MLGNRDTLFFQGLEKLTANFSKPWKISPEFFQAPEKSVQKFPSLGKLSQLVGGSYSSRAPSPPRAPAPHPHSA